MFLCCARELDEEEINVSVVGLHQQVCMHPWGIHPFCTSFSYIKRGIWKKRGSHNSLLMGAVWPGKNFQCKYRISLSKESKHQLLCLHALRINPISSPSGGQGPGNLSAQCACQFIDVDLRQTPHTALECKNPEFYISHHSRVLLLHSSQSQMSGYHSCAEMPPLTASVCQRSDVCLWKKNKISRNDDICAK